MKYLPVFAVALLSGCAAVSTAMEYDRKVHHVKMADDTYRIFEHPSRDRIMTTPSVGRALGSGFAKGATFGLANTLTPEQKHEAAARQYLDDTGRAHCRITGGYLLAQPQYEFFFDCT